MKPTLGEQQKALKDFFEIFDPVGRTKGLSHQTRRYLDGEPSQIDDADLLKVRLDKICKVLRSGTP